MKKIFNNPKIMAIASIVLCAINLISILIIYPPNEIIESFWYSISIWDYSFKFNIFIYSLSKIFELVLTIVLIIYFLLIILKKRIHIKAFNIIVFISFFILSLNALFGIRIFDSYSWIWLINLLFELFPVIYLGYIFWVKNKKVKTLNILANIGIVVSLLSLLEVIIIRYFVVSTIYFLSMILYFITIYLYFRLYGLSLIKKEKNNE